MGTDVFITQTGSRYHSRTDATCMEHANSFQVVPLETAAAGGLRPCLKCDAPGLPGTTEGDTRWLRTVDEWDRNNLFDTFWEQAFARRVLAATPGIEADDVEIQQYITIGSETHKVDFFVPKAKLILEIDGYAKDGSPPSQLEIEKRNRKDAIYQSGGMAILHFSNAQVMHEPETCRSQVASMLAGRSASMPPTTSLLPSEQPTDSPGFAGSEALKQEPPSMATNLISRAGKKIVWAIVAILAVAVAFGVAFAMLSKSEPTPVNPTTPVNPKAPVQAAKSILPSNGNCPASHPLKGNNTDGGEFIVHAPGQQFYDKTDAELCFASIEDAVAAGYRPPK